MAPPLNRRPESAALCCGYSLRNRLQKPEAERSSLPHECDTTQPASVERGQLQNRPMCAREGRKPGESVPDRDRKDDGPGYRVRFAAVSGLSRVATFVLKALPSVTIATIRTAKPRIRIPRAAGRSQRSLPGMSTGKKLCIQSSILSDPANNHPENDLRSAILYLALTRARLRIRQEEDFPTPPTPLSAH